MRSSSASSAAAISSASELLPSSSQLEPLLDSLAASSSFSFLLWPLEDKHTHACHSATRNGASMVEDTRGATRSGTRTHKLPPLPSLPGSAFQSTEMWGWQKSSNATGENNSGSR